MLTLALRMYLKTQLYMYVLISRFRSMYNFPRLVFVHFVPDACYRQHHCNSDCPLSKSTKAHLCHRSRNIVIVVQAGTCINIHVPASLSRIITSGLLLGTVLTDFTCWFHNMVIIIYYYYHYYHCYYYFIFTHPKTYYVTARVTDGWVGYLNTIRDPTRSD